MSLDWFPKKKERYCKKGDMFVGSLGLREQEGIYNAGRNDAIDECESAVMKMLDKEKMKKVLWKAIPNVHEEVNEYELRADNGDYSPNEHERMLMEDFAHGLVEEIVDNATQAFIDYMKEGLWEILI